jgi:hypothetical protein
VSNTAQSDFLEINFKCVMITKNWLYNPSHRRQ